MRSLKVRLLTCPIGTTSSDIVHEGPGRCDILDFPEIDRFCGPPWLPMKLESRETLYANVASENGWLEDERSFWRGVDGLFFQGLCRRPCQFHGGYTNHVYINIYIYTQNCISGSSSEFASPRVVNYIDRCPVSLSVVTLSHLDLYLIHWRKWANKTIYTQKSQ